MDLSGRTAVVTGASKGIGAATATALADAGAAVAICARSRREIETLGEMIEDDGGTAFAMRADVRDEFDMERLMEEAAKLGSSNNIDLVVANAGVYHGDPGETPLAEESYSAFDDSIRTNARGVFATIREAVPHLSEEARVLVPSGAVARNAQPGYGSYAVSKAAGEALARGFAVELEQAVGIVDPGQIATELTGEQGRRGPEDAAEMLVWAAGLPADELDGEVVNLKQFMQAQRS
ncbi:MAG: SDR family oxidoreductase [Halobacteriales archaeon]